MSTKTVYQCDDDGILVGEATARESPMEPGVWHLPAGCVDAAPPALAAGERARWTGAAWEIVPPEPEPPPEAERPRTQDELLGYARERRLAAEAAGVTVAGVTYASDMESQARIVATLSYLAAAGLDAVGWKSLAGYVVLTLAQLQAAGLAVGAHVQACFAAEAAVAAAIAHGDIATYAEIDAAAWPGGEAGA